MAAFGPPGGTAEHASRPLTRAKLATVVQDSDEGDGAVQFAPRADRAAFPAGETWTFQPAMTSPA